MTISVKNLLLNSTRLTAVSSALAIGTMLFMAPAAYAQCSPDPTDGNDVITCTGDLGTLTFRTGDGDDMVTASNANPTTTPNFDINTEAGNDTIVIVDSFINDVRPDDNNAQAGNDTVTITNSTILVRTQPF